MPNTLLCAPMRHIAKALVVSLALCSAPLASAGPGARWIEVEGGSWSPQIEALKRIDKEIELYVGTKAKAEGRALKEWTAYTFQYQGQEEKGRRIIFINAFCITNDRWKLSKEMVLVEDGGTCFFSLKYDQEKRLFFELSINGEA